MILRLLFAVLLFAQFTGSSQNLVLQYKVFIPQPISHKYHVELQLNNWTGDTLVLKMPKWMPGYYQIMDYAKNLEAITIKDDRLKDIQFQRVADNTVRIAGAKGKPLTLSYDVTTTRQFVATS